MAQVLREERGPRPLRARPSHERRTRFLRCDVMWSSDFFEAAGRCLIKTLDEKALFKPGCERAPSESGAAAVAHARGILERMRRVPLIWKYDHGSAFTGRLFQDLLAEHRIVPYPTRCRAPWTNGRTEREHREVLAWLREAERLSDERFDADLDEGLLTLNFVKPRAVLGFRRSAEVYFRDPGLAGIDRERFIAELDEEKRRLGGRGERVHRLAVRNLLTRWKLYEEWDPASG